MNQLLLNALILLNARLAEIATYLRLLSLPNTPVVGTQVPDVVKQANLEGVAEEDIWVPRVVAEITNADVYQFPTVPHDGPAGAPAIAGLPSAVAAVQTALTQLGSSPTTAPLAAAVAALQGLLVPLVGKIPVSAIPTPATLPTPTK